MSQITNLKGTDKLREAYPLINQNMANLNADIGLLLGSTVDNVTLSRDGAGEVTGVQETNEAGTLTNTSWTFNPDGTLNTVTEVIGTQTITSTMNYTAGELISVSKVIT